MPFRADREVEVLPLRGADEQRQPGRVEIQVGVDVGDVAPAGLERPDLDRVALAEIPVVVDDANAAGGRLQRPLCRAVDRAVGDDDQLERLVETGCDRLLDRGDVVDDRGLLVEDRHDHAQQDVLPRRDRALGGCRRGPPLARRHGSVRPAAADKLRDIRVDEHAHEGDEVRRRLPAETLASLGRVADEIVQLRPAAPQRLVDANVVAPVEAEVLECALHEILDRVGDAGRDHVVVGLVLLQHQPHRADVVAGEAPVATGVEVAEEQSLVEPERDPGRAVRHLAGQEVERAPRRLVVVEDAGRRVEPVPAPVRADDEERVRLRRPVRGQRRDGRVLGLRRLERLPEDLARRGLVDPRLGHDAANRLQQRGRPDGGELGRQHRLLPGHRDEGGRREVVDLVRLRGLERLDERALVQQVGLHQIDRSRIRSRLGYASGATRRTTPKTS